MIEGKDQYFLISHYRERVQMNSCLFVNSCGVELFECTTTEAMSLGIEGISYCNFNFNLRFKKQSVALQNKRFKIPPSTSVHFASRVRRSLVACLS
jgi:hypothetical protein